MKSFLVLCIALAFESSDANTISLTPQQQEKAKQYIVECMKETGVKPELVMQMKEGSINDDEELKKFALCFFQKAGIMDSEGNLDVNTALSKLPPGINKAEAEQLLKSCKNKIGKTPADTSYQIFKCYGDGTKTHIHLGF